MESSVILVILLILSCNDSSFGKRSHRRTIAGTIVPSHHRTVAGTIAAEASVATQFVTITDPSHVVDEQKNDNERNSYVQKQQKQGKFLAIYLKNVNKEQDTKHVNNKRITKDIARKTIQRNLLRDTVNKTNKSLFERKPSLTKIPIIKENFYNEINNKTKRNKLRLKPSKHNLQRHKRDITDLPLDGFGSSPQLWTLLPPTTLGPAWNRGPDMGMAPVLFTSEEPPIMPQDIPGDEDVVMTPMETNINFGPGTDLEDRNTDDTDLETEPEPWPEPSPDWTTAYMYLGVAWFVHIYGFAFTMFLIGTLATLTLVNIVSSKNLTSRGLSTSLNCLLLLFGFSRGISLVLNPYGSLERISLLASRLMWSVGFPCLTSMLTTLLLVLVDTTKVSLGPPRFQQFHVVIKLSASHFIVVLGTDIILSFYLQLKALLLVCQLIYVTWSILLTVGYYRVGYLISRNFKASRDSQTVSDRGARRLERLIFACGTVALFNCITHLYGAAGVFGVYSDLNFVPAWPWWVFQTLMRLEEISMCLIVLLLAGKSRRDACSTAVEGEASFICRCWRKLKSRLTITNSGTRNSGINQQLESDKRDMTNIVESWGTYGTNANTGHTAPTNSNGRIDQHNSMDIVDEGET